MAGLKKSWFGYVAQRKADLAEEYDAVVVTEDLDIVAVPKDDPAYKGRTFNKMINNGAKGQYILRSENTLKWRAVASVKVPSYFTSSSDWRTGTVDKDQRRGLVFRAASDDGSRSSHHPICDVLIFTGPNFAVEMSAAIGRVHYSRHLGFGSEQERPVHECLHVTVHDDLIREIGE